MNQLGTCQRTGAFFLSTAFEGDRGDKVYRPRSAAGRVIVNVVSLGLGGRNALQHPSHPATDRESDANDSVSAITRKVRRSTFPECELVPGSSTDVETEGRVGWLRRRTREFKLGKYPLQTDPGAILGVVSLPGGGSRAGNSAEMSATHPTSDSFPFDSPSAANRRCRRRFILL